MADWGGDFSFFQFFQIWQGDISTGFDSNEANEADVCDVITSRSRDKLETHYISTTRVVHQTWQDSNVTCP